MSIVDTRLFMPQAVLRSIAVQKPQGREHLVWQRLKQSGMRWTVRGANAIIALRCCQISGRWEEFWGNRAAG
jgi:hypothetical protein